MFGGEALWPAFYGEWEEMEPKEEVMMSLAQKPCDMIVKITIPH